MRTPTRTRRPRTRSSEHEPDYPRCVNVGSSKLAALLSHRKAADEHLRNEICNKTAGWGVSVTSVEIRDVAIPVALQNAMSRQAQAEREKQARVILGSAEAEIAGNLSRPLRSMPTIPRPCKCVP